MKTKTLVTLLAVIGMTVALITTSNAETIPGCGCKTEGFSPTTGQPCAGNVPGLNPVPNQLPIGDATDIQACAWEQVTQIGMWGWAPSSIRSSTNVKSEVWLPYSPTNGVDIEEIFGIIRAQQLLLSVLYPSDSVSLQVGLYDSSRDNLFDSYSSSPINPPRNGVSRNLLDVIFNMSSEIWIPFSGAEWFRIIERNTNGNPVRYYSSQEYDVQNGRIRFPAYFSKKGGEIIIGFCDGTEVAYALNGGRKIVPTTVEIGIGNVSALGTRTFRRTNAAYVEVTPAEFDRNINPLSQFIHELPGGEGSIYLSAWIRESNGQIKEWATMAYIWFQGQPSSTAQKIEITLPNHVAWASKPSGRYWIKYGFPSGWPHGKNQFNPPYQGGGSSGGGSSSTPAVIIEN